MTEIKFPGSWTMGMRVYLTVGGGGMWKSKNADYEGEINVSQNPKQKVV